MSDITTYSGEDFNPLHPEISKIHITDIAHALSLMCRANGHFIRFYSVAQHSVNCAIEAWARNYSKKVQLACLLHDASEAYIADITRPVKPHLTNYMEIEEQLQSLIYQKFITEPLSSEEHSQVRQIDDDLLICEFDVLMHKSVFESQPKMSGKLRFELASFDFVERQYLKTWADLTEQKTENSFQDHRFISVGIDGCKGKWLAVAISDIEQDVKLFDTIEGACNCYQNADSILIDKMLSHEGTQWIIQIH